MTKCCLTVLFALMFGSVFALDPIKKTKQGIQLAEQGKLKEAFHCFTEAREEYRIRNDKEGLAIVINDIGRIYLMMSDFHEARKNFWHSYSIYKSLKQKDAQAQIIMNIGASYELETKRKDALEMGLYYYKKGYRIYGEIGDSLGVSRSLINIGSVYGRKGQTRKALEAYMKALPYLEKHDGSLERATVYGNIGTSYYELGEPKAALPYLYKALDVRDDVENDLYKYRTLAKVYAELNEPDSVAYYIDQFSDARDALQNEQTIRSVAEISQKYKARVKEEEIARLKVSKKKDRLWLTLIISGLLALVIILWLFFRNRMIRLDHQKTDLEHRILRAQMNPHFLFNCLSSIQRAYVEGNTTKANDLTADFGHLLRRILDHTSRNKIRLNDELETLNTYIQIEQIRLDAKFQFEIVVEEELDPDSIFVPPLITQPIVENAIWHGIVPLHKEGNIRIACSVSKSGKLLVITVEDDGAGYVEKKMKSGRTSKGMELVEKRLKTKGNVMIAARPEGGTKVTINIPIDYEN